MIMEEQEAIRATTERRRLVGEKSMYFTSPANYDGVNMQVGKRERDGRRAECTQNSHTRDTQMEQGTNLQKEFW